MAGFIFSISQEEGIEGVKKCIKKGYFASVVPNEKLSINTKAKQVAAAVMADYCSMKEGDNVYFLSKRLIYGVGKLVNVGPECKYKNYLSAHALQYKKSMLGADEALVNLGPRYRWICFFEPEEQFFDVGVDMDEVLMYKPAAFKMLRAFQGSTFIKIDDEENRALKECIYLKNRENDKFFEYSDSEHIRISNMNLEKYIIKPEETISLEYNSDTNEINLEMLLEAGLVNRIVREGFEGQRYDYVTHQVIASPFKPLAYIDKMDIFAYKYLEKYPDSHKPIEKYMVIEVKKGKANSELLLQLMRYVDWISKEYAAGDYSLIKAVGVARGYRKGVQKVLEQECTRSYLSDIHPNKTSIWNDLTLYEYYFDVNTGIELRKSDMFDGALGLQKRLEKLGIEISKNPISKNGQNILIRSLQNP